MTNEILAGDLAGASDLWCVPKALGEMTVEEAVTAWRRTASFLDHLAAAAETLENETLNLALVDAMSRSQEELHRVEDRLVRPEGAELGPREEERLRNLLRCSDAFSMALFYTEKAEEVGHRKAAPETLEVLEAAHREANSQFERYRAETGVAEHRNTNIQL